MDRLLELEGLFWESVVETLYIVAVTLGIGGVGGLVIGVTLYVTRKNGLLANAPVSIVLNLVVNFFRPIPFVIFIGAVQPLARWVVGVGIGNRAIIFALSLAAAFGISRIVEQNLVGVDPGVVEAARAMGAGRPRIILTVLIPEALGPLVLGYTFVFVALVDMSAIAGVIGGGGLGNFAIVYGYRQFNPVVTWVAVIAIVVIVQVAQFAGNRLARTILRR
ncbi:ABC transporter permease [Actinophytocola xinjiangensis]|uniref:ABC transporter permease n=1 Tax=Actinophytocola xinjiangensis TaxID=485602 RepID=A0A7Z0WNT0_9PSEU|nr:ABC transporter permease subunit [Actinophytocola xinjiangensis]OLF11958.1 ABC transporter permease [Actinophytocola xinjiangensis]